MAAPLVLPCHLRGDAASPPRLAAGEAAAFPPAAGRAPALPLLPLRRTAGAARTTGPPRLRRSACPAAASVLIPCRPAPLRPLDRPENPRRAPPAGESAGPGCTGTAPDGPAPAPGPLAVHPARAAGTLSLGPATSPVQQSSSPSDPAAERRAPTSSAGEQRRALIDSVGSRTRPLRGGERRGTRKESDSRQFLHGSWTQSRRPRGEEARARYTLRAAEASHVNAPVEWRPKRAPRFNDALPSLPKVVEMDVHRSVPAVCAREETDD